MLRYWYNITCHLNKAGEMHYGYKVSKVCLDNKVQGSEGHIRAVTLEGWGK